MSYQAAPKAKTKASELMGHLVRATEDHLTDELTLHRLETGAATVMSADAGVAHTVLAGVAALRFDVRAVREHFRIALQQSSNSPATLFNQSIALQYVEEAESAFESASRALEGAPGDPRYLDSAIRRAFEGGHFRAMGEYCARYNAARPEEGPHDFTTMSAELASALDAGAFSEAAVRRVIALFCEIQQRHKVHRDAVRLSLDLEEPFSFAFRKSIWATPEKAADLNFEFANEWATRQDVVEDPGLLFTVSFVGIA